MKTLLRLSVTMCYALCFGQVTPSVVFASPTVVKGTAGLNETIEISTNNDFVAEAKTTTDSKTGDFTFTFTTPLNVGENVILWSINKDNATSQKIVAKIENPENILQTLISDNSSSRKFTSPEVAGKTLNYKATIWNTNFSVPLARFNFTSNSSQKKGDVLLFNSIGAGFGISAGELSETRDFDGKLINQEFINTFGVHLGFLFSAGTGDDTKNVFAPTLNVSVLDFQFGMGYELGDLSDNQKPLFLTLSYAIPLYKLRKGGFWIWKSSKPITSTDESRLGE